MNQNIDKFDNFLLEKSRAERKLKRAEKKLRKAKEHSEEGKDEKAKREIEKAKELLAKVKELDPKLDIAEVESDITEVEDVDWKEEFDITTAFLGKRVKSDDFDCIKKIKIVGNEISPEEVILFLKSVRTYINQNWDDIKDGDGKEDYRSTHNDKMVLDINNKSKKITFTYKEKGGIFVDKAKLEIDKDIFDDKENRDKMSAELDKLIGTKHFVGKEGKVSQKYNVDKDKVILKDVAVGDVIVKKAETIGENPKVQQEIKELVTPSASFIKDSINLLVAEKLNLGGLTDMANTDEQKIFDWFVANNAKKTINSKNVDAILTGYKRKKAITNEAWYNDWDDFTDATVGGVKRAWKSVAGTESEGVVKDLIKAFNTDAKTVSNDMNDMLRKMGDAYGDLITKEVEKASVKIKQNANANPEKYEQLAEGLTLNENSSASVINNIMIGTTVASAIPSLKNKKPSTASLKSANAVKKNMGKLSPKELFAKGKGVNGKFLSKEAIAKGNTRAGKRALRKAEKTFVRNVAKQGVKQGAKRGLGGLLMRGGGGMASLLGIGSIPVVGWVIIAVVAVGAMWYWLYNTFSEQQHQIAHIFLLMWASQSPIFLQEMKRAGIRINENMKLNIDEEKLGSMLGQSVIEDETETEEVEYEEVEDGTEMQSESKVNESRTSVKTFESFINVSNDTKSAYNTVMFNMSVTDEEENIVFNENVEYDAIKELKKDFKEKGYKIAIKKVSDKKDEK